MWLTAAKAFAINKWFGLRFKKHKEGKKEGREGGREERKRRRKGEGRRGREGEREREGKRETETERGETEKERERERQRQRETERDRDRKKMFTNRTALRIFPYVHSFLYFTIKGMIRSLAAATRVGAPGARARKENPRVVRKWQTSRT